VGFDSEVARRSSVGQATQQDVWRHVAERFSLEPARLRDLQRDFWAGDRLDESLMALLAGLRPRYTTAILSNAWLGLRGLYQQWFGLDDGVVDVLIYSGEVGLAKPDPRIYQLALERLPAAAPEAVFVDDFIENIRAAQALGMQAVHFRTALQARQELEAVLGRDGWSSTST